MEQTFQHFQSQPDDFFAPSRSGARSADVFEFNNTTPTWEPIRNGQGRFPGITKPKTSQRAERKAAKTTGIVVPQSDRAYIGNSTVKGKSGTWQFIGKLDAASEKPNFRTSVVELERQFHEAMDVVDKGKNATFAEVVDTSIADGLVSPCESDYISMQGQVDAHMAMRKHVSEFVAESKPSALASPTSAARANAGEAFPLDDKSASNVMSSSFWDVTKSTLANCLYEQKWIDLTTSELSNQVAVGCLEQGRLLRLLRLRMASVFERMAMLHSDALWQLDAAIQGLRESSQAATEAAERRNKGEEQLRAEFDDKIRRLKEEFAQREIGHADVEKESQRQVDRMGATTTHDYSLHICT